MWKILGVLAFCGLLSPAEGTIFGIRVALSPDEMGKAFKRTLSQDGFLEKHLTRVSLRDIKFANIVGLRIANAKLTDAKVVFRDGIIQVELYILPYITGFVFLKLPSSSMAISGNLHVKFAYHVENYLKGQVDVRVFECGIVFEALQTQFFGIGLPPSLETSMLKSLVTDLQQQVCAVTPIFLDDVKNKWLGTINAAFSQDPYGKVAYLMAALPVIKPIRLGIDSSVSFQLQGSGIIISIPDSAPSIEAPPLDGHDYCIAIHSEVFNILLGVIASKLHLEGSYNPEVSDLTQKITIEAIPVIALKTTGATVTLTVNVQFLGNVPYGSKVSLGIVRCDLLLEVTFALVDEKVTLSLSLSENVITPVSAPVVLTDVSISQGPVDKLVNEVFLPAFNERLSHGLHLPRTLDIPLEKMSIVIVQNCLLIYR